MECVGTSLAWDVGLGLIVYERIDQMCPFVRVMWCDDVCVLSVFLVGFWWTKDWEVRWTGAVVRNLYNYWACMAWPAAIVLTTYGSVWVPMYARMHMYCSTVLWWQEQISMASLACKGTISNVLLIPSIERFLRSCYFNPTYSLLYHLNVPPSPAPLCPYINAPLLFIRERFWCFRFSEWTFLIDWNILLYCKI